jgi:hypothetical protein
MDVAAALLARARAVGARSLAVVGTSKNAGKSVVVAALADALWRAREPYGLCSIGRDGEAADALDAAPKPRFFLRPGADVATAASLVPRSPALEITAVTSERSALGPIVLARVRAPGFVEIAGPPSAHALRRVAAALAADGRVVVIDGAVDRIAALRDGDDAIVVAVGAAGAPTLGHAVDDVAALVGRLRVPVYDPDRPFLRIAGALTAAAAAGFVRAGEARQIVVRDPTRIAFAGRAFAEVATRLDLRCERTLRPIACTVAPLGAERAFEPRAFARAVAERTGLPVFDVYAGTAAGISAA